MLDQTTGRELTAGVRMKAVVQEGYGPPEDVLRLKEVDRPGVAADEVLVRMRATSVNTPDWITVTGTPTFIRLQAGLRKPPSPIRGTDVAGVVAAIGRDVNHVAPGDEVFGSWWTGKLRTQGTFAEFSVGPADQLVAKPASLSFEEAAAAGMSGLTALCAIRDVGEVGRGTRVLINGASGGVGTFAVQMARSLGAEVTGVSSTRNLELLRSLGADHVIDYTVEDYTQGDERYDVILDNAMNHPPSATARALSKDGILLPNSAGTSGGFLGGLPRMGRAAVMGLGRTDVRFVGDWVPPKREDLETLASMLATGDITAVVDTVYALEEAGKAVGHMLGHHARGNVVIAI